MSGVFNETTERVFGITRLTDSYGKEYRIQQSSRAVFANEDGTVDDPLGWIWLGIVDPEPKIMCADARKVGLNPRGDRGWMPYPLPSEVLLTTEMHLSEANVRELIGELQKWLDQRDSQSGGPE